MTHHRPLDPSRVRITEHAVSRYLMRYPGDLLPRRPEREIRSLLRIATPINPKRSPVRSKSLAASVLYRAQKWIFPLLPSAEPDYDWVLPTVLRSEPHINNATAFLRERLAHWNAFRSGEADQLLVKLAQELGTIDGHELCREWRARRYPPVQHGGYQTFRDYYTSRLKLLHAAFSAAAAAEEVKTP